MKSTISEFHKYPQCGYLEYPNRRVPQNNKTVMPIMQLSVEFFRKLEWPFLYTHSIIIILYSNIICKLLLSYNSTWVRFVPYQGGVEAT